MRGFAFVDVETSGLSPVEHEVIEFAVIIEEAGHAVVFTGALDFDVDAASPEALAVNGYGQREFPRRADRGEAAGKIQAMTCDRHLVGKNPGFDAGFLAALLDREGYEADWHHRLVDVGALAWGYLNGTVYGGGVVDQPLDTDQVAELMGIPRPLTNEGFHCALYDAAWAQEVFRHIVPGGDD